MKFSDINNLFPGLEKKVRNFLEENPYNGTGKDLELERFETIKESKQTLCIMPTEIKEQSIVDRDYTWENNLRKIGAEYNLSLVLHPRYYEN